MSISSGFFNSVNHDRAYNAIQMGQMFDGLITDGVFSAVLDHFMVRQTPSPSMNVSVGSGRAWFKNTWTYNDGNVFLSIDPASTSDNRIDCVVLKVNKTEEVRENTVYVEKGEPAVSPVKPTFVDGADVFYYPLAYVYVNAGTTQITDELIENAIGVDPKTPFVSGILQQVTVEELLNQWETEFRAWLDMLQAILDENVAGHLQNEIDALIEDEFKTRYDMCNATTVYTRNNDGDITGWTTTGPGNIIATTTITDNSTAKTYVTAVNDGMFVWTKTSTFTKATSTLTESYTKTDAP